MIFNARARCRPGITLCSWYRSFTHANPIGSRHKRLPGRDAVLDLWLDYKIEGIFTGCTGVRALRFFHGCGSKVIHNHFGHHLTRQEMSQTRCAMQFGDLDFRGVGGESKAADSSRR